MLLSAWLFDVYPAGAGMLVWLLDENGRMHALHDDDFTPCFYVRGPENELAALTASLRSRRDVRLRRTVRRDLFLDRELEVLEIGVRPPVRLPGVLHAAAEAFPQLTYYDADIPLPQRYVLARGVFPVALCQVEYTLPEGHRDGVSGGPSRPEPGEGKARAVVEGRLRSIATLDTPWEIDYRLPPLRAMSLYLVNRHGEVVEGERGETAETEERRREHTSRGDRNPSLGAERNPAHARRGTRQTHADLVVEVDGRQHVFPRRHGRRLLLGVRHLLERHDPDLIVTAFGDSYLLPRLLHLSQHYGIPLPLNRDPHQTVAHKAARSYFSYGRIIFRDEQHLLFGRWHIDHRNAFLSDDYGLDGTVEIARLSGLPVQTVARVSTGTGISAMQVATAWRRGVLVPWQKRQPESLKSGIDLLHADKGGLVYTPTPGLHQHVAELDFTAMYPSIMVHFNISPETVGAACCDGVPVPELGTPICRHRQGLVPETLAPLLEKRRRYKALVRALPADDPRRQAFQRRYSAHKWLLVTCFGYLGYKNARFGRIEAHEAVTAYGREVLLRAKEIVEERGFRVLHLYVDGLWIDRPGAAQRPDYETLLAEIEQGTGLHIALEGIYRWLAFLPSRVEPRVTVANRYFGAFEDGTLKVRGIEARRHDTPTFIRQTQLGALEILAAAPDAAAYRRLPQAIAYAPAADDRSAGQAPLDELIVTHNLSRRPEEFVVRTPAARVAAELTGAGVELSPGESLRFLYVPGPEKARAWDLIDAPTLYDDQAYTVLLLRALESLFAPVGVDTAPWPCGWARRLLGLLDPPPTVDALAALVSYGAAPSRTPPPSDFCSRRRSVRRRGRRRSSPSVVSQKRRACASIGGASNQDLRFRLKDSAGATHRPRPSIVVGFSAARVTVQTAPHREARNLFVLVLHPGAAVLMAAGARIVHQRGRMARGAVPAGTAVIHRERMRTVKRCRTPRARRMAGAAIAAKNASMRGGPGVAGRTRGRRAGETAAAVAASAGRAAVGPRQRERREVVVECPIGPGRRPMAGPTFGAESAVVSVVIGMAPDTGRRRVDVPAARVTVTAAHLGVRRFQGEAGAGVREDQVIPA
jgi:DNA polymerase-2